jgi:hypothetical protein
MHRLNRYSPATATFIIIALAVYAPAQSQTKRWVSGIPDILQNRDDSVPVIITSIRMTPDKEYRERAGIKSGRLRNRSANTVRAVKLRWLATTAGDSKKRERIFEQAEMELFNVQIPAGDEREMEIPLPQLNEKLRKWMAENPLDEGLAITISVSEVFFEDGSSWKAEAINTTVH